MVTEFGWFFSRCCFCSGLQAQPVSVPFRWVHGEIIVRCTTPTGEQNRLVDTGAETSAIDISVSRGLPLISSTQVVGVAGNHMAEMRTGDLTLAGTTLEMPVVVTRLPKDYTVIIGSDFLRNSVSLKVNYTARTIEIGQ